MKGINGKLDGILKAGGFVSGDDTMKEHEDLESKIKERGRTIEVTTVSESSEINLHSRGYHVELAVRNMPKETILSCQNGIYL